MRNSGRFACCCFLGWLNAGCTGELGAGATPAGQGTGGSIFTESADTGGSGPGPEVPLPDPAQEQPRAAVGREFSCDAGALTQPGSSIVSRLSISEYANSIRDLFGVDVRAQAEQLPDGLPTLREFNNQSSSMTMEHATVIADIASTVADQVDPVETISRYAPGCVDLSTACTDSLIAELGRDVLRGPVRDVEQRALEKTVTAAQEEELSLEETTRYLVSAMLRAPRFLYRVELETGEEGVRELDDYHYCVVSTRCK